MNADGCLGARNDVVCASLEHKLGIHASPTAVIKYGEKDGAIGYLVGEENRGLNTMFIMMNAARLAVGVQGVAVAERATQRAIAYANERKQGRSAKGSAGEMSPIIEHPDMRRNLHDHEGADAGRARHLPRHRARARHRAQRARMRVRGRLPPPAPRC